MLAGTAVLPNPQLINCSSAICAEASCIATLSGLSLRFAWPRITLQLFVFDSNDSSGFSRCAYRIFSARVRWREVPRTRRTSARRASNLGYGGVRVERSTLRAVGGSWVVARVRRGERRREEQEVRRGWYHVSVFSCC
jgi:hypothetical protein